MDTKLRLGHSVLAWNDDRKRSEAIKGTLVCVPECRYPQPKPKQDELIDNRPTCNGKVIEIEGKKYKLVEL